MNEGGDNIGCRLGFWMLVHRAWAHGSRTYLCSTFQPWWCITSLNVILVSHRWEDRFRALFFGGLNSEQLSFWKRAFHFFRSTYGVFSNFLTVSQKESSTLLQLREILLRTVGCTGVLPFVVNCQKVQCSTADWRWYFNFLLRCTWLVLFSKDIAFRLLSIFQLLLDWNC